MFESTGHDAAEAPQAQRPAGMIDAPVGDAVEIRLIESAKLFIRKTLEQQSVSPATQRSWDDFFRVYSRVIRCFAIRQGLRGSDVDDCVQEAWHYVVKKLPEFEIRGVRTGFRPWLYRVVASISIDLCRARARRCEVHFDSNGSDAANNISEPSASSADGLEWRQSMIAILLGQIQDKISRNNYRIIEMRFLEGKSVTEVAQALGMSPRQVWYRQHRVLKKLRKLAERYTGGMFRPLESVDTRN